MTLEQIIEAAERARLIDASVAEQRRDELEQLRDIADDEGRTVYLTAEERAKLQDDPNRSLSVMLGNLTAAYCSRTERCMFDEGHAGACYPGRLLPRGHT